MLDGPIGQEILASLKPHGLVGLAFYDSGSRSIYNSVRPINTLADAKGLRIRSMLDDEAQGIVVAEWQPEKHHEAFEGVLSGGIIGTLLDCHCNWSAAYALMRANGADTPPCTVTAEYSIGLKRPTPTDGPVRLRAHAIAHVAALHHGRPRGCRPAAVFAAVPPAIQSLAPSFGSKAFRASNAVTSSCFSDQTFTKPLVNEAGETSAISDGLSSGVRSAFFETEWDFISADPSVEQVGLGITVSPDRGDGARMSWIRMEDKPTGIDVIFNDYQHNLVPTPDFVQTTVATGLNRGSAHHIKVTIVFVDGPANDILRIFVDGSGRWVFKIAAFSGDTQPGSGSDAQLCNAYSYTSQ